MARYLRHLEDALPRAGALRVMKSDGGVVSAARARSQAVQTALSGPAAGVIGAFHLAKLAGFDHILTLDIGGTSTDVALCPGRLVRHPQATIGDLPLRIRLLDIETIGAGGGSLARVDAGGALRVGPESAGADPGPVIYGRGGTQITVSDANALLGRLDARRFLGGRMALDLDGARAAMAALADQTGLTPEATALGVIDVANVSIDRALRRVSVARGHDPRDFTLVAFGGAGPLHACDVADRLQIPRVLVPPMPGVLCALGLLVADVLLDASRAILAPVDAGLAVRLEAALSEMVVQARSELATEGIPVGRMRFGATLDMRYAGQAHELAVTLDGLGGWTADELCAAFHAVHRQTYGHALPDRAVEVVTLRLEAVGEIDKPAFAAEPPGSPDASPARVGQTDGLFHAGRRTMDLYERDRLRPGMRLDGPALICQMDSTILLPPGWTARVDGYRNLILERIP